MLKYKVAIAFAIVLLKEVVTMYYVVMFALAVFVIMSVILPVVFVIGLIKEESSSLGDHITIIVGDKEQRSPKVSWKIYLLSIIGIIGTIAWCFTVDCSTARTVTVYATNTVKIIGVDEDYDILTWWSEDDNCHYTEFRSSRFAIIDEETDARPYCEHFTELTFRRVELFGKMYYGVAEEEEVYYFYITKGMFENLVGMKSPIGP